MVTLEKMGSLVGKAPHLKGGLGGKAPQFRIYLVGLG